VTSVTGDAADDPDAYDAGEREAIRREGVLQ
jgi:hypothetical protein